MTLDFTAAAISDLRSIRTYTIENWGADQEQVYLDSLWAKFEEILDTPGKWRRRNDLFPGCQIAAQGTVGGNTGSGSGANCVNGMFPSGSSWPAAGGRQ